MANTFVNPSVVAKEALMHVENNCVMGNLVYRGYEEEWNVLHRGWKPGSSISIKVPMYARVKDGSTIDVVDLFEQSTTFTLNYRKHVAHRLTSEELTYSFNKFSERVIQPAALALANYVDDILLGLYKGIANQVGAPGLTPQNLLTFNLAAARLDDLAVPQNDRHCIIDPTTQAYLSDHLKGLFHTSMVGGAVKKNRLPEIAGFDMYKSQNVNNHTCGTAAGRTDVLIHNETAIAEGVQVVEVDTNGSWAHTLTAGDIFDVASVFAVNPVSGKKLGYKRQFVVASHVDEGAYGTLTTYPGLSPYSIYSASADEDKLPYQTVDALHANNAAVAVAGSTGLVHPVNLGFHRHAFGLVMVPLEPLVNAKTSTISKNGYTISVTQDSDIINYANYIRFDVLFGAKVLNPFFACRIAG